jgi:pyruvate carboxylase subunit B
MLEKEGLPVNDENIFIAAACKEKGIQYLKGEAKVNVRKVDPKAAKEEAAGSSAGAGQGSGGAYTVTVGGKKFNVTLEGNNAVVNGKSYSVDVAAGGASGSGAAAGSGEGQKVEAPMPGLILRLEKSVGDSVEEGELIMVMEAMKMETEIHAPTAGTITDIPVKQGDQMKAGETLAVIG